MRGAAMRGLRCGGLRCGGLRCGGLRCGGLRCGGLRCGDCGAGAAMRGLRCGGLRCARFGGGAIWRACVGVAGAVGFVGLGTNLEGLRRDGGREGCARVFGARAWRNALGGELARMRGAMFFCWEVFGRARAADRVEFASVERHIERSRCVIVERVVERSSVPFS